MGFLIAVLLAAPALALLVHAQPGFLSLDCGLPPDTNYTDDQTGITYISDASFTDSGASRTISPMYQQSAILTRQTAYVRSFPRGPRNCYTLPLQETHGAKYLIRAVFMYGKYDGGYQLPEFDLYIGVNLWDSVKLQDAYTIIDMEIIHVPNSEKLRICLVNTGMGTPFISALELRLLKNSSLYKPQSGSLVTSARWDLASSTNGTIRYPDDKYDRKWYPARHDWVELSSSHPIECNPYCPPQKVMRTAISAPNTSSPLILQWKKGRLPSNVYFYLHFTDIQKPNNDDTRKFNISVNEDQWYHHFVPPVFSTQTIFTPTPLEPVADFYITLTKTGNSTLPPIINAIEVYGVKQLSKPETELRDVDAAMKIKSMYRVKRNWQGDPCIPENYSWDGLSCHQDGDNPPRIISLNLSSSGLTSHIAPYLSDLSMIRSLDLSNNSLTGRVPSFLSQLQFLETLNLTGNNFSGPIPDGLIQKSNNGLLSLSVDGNLCPTTDCKSNSTGNGNSANKKDMKKLVVPLVVVATVSAMLIILGASSIHCFLKKRDPVTKLGKVDNKQEQQGTLESTKRQFTYSEVLTITSNLEKVIGIGGFGTVYHGYLDKNNQVAVKMLSPASAQTNEQFHNEAQLLMRVHHRNLTSLVGYCNEGTNLGLVYEYMENGNLGEHLSERNANGFNWGKRLEVMIDSAQGLEYLHHGCKPPIIHRDVKSTNILLNEQFQAKLSDFGLSKIFPAETCSHVSTRVIGTPGYLDPEYNLTNWLNEKSDIYSFGIVLLEMITGRPVFARDHGRAHIIRWVTPLLENGEIREIIDPRLNGEFNINSAWKAVELATACTSPCPAERPNMNHVVMELKECLMVEKMQPREAHHTEPTFAPDVVPPNLDSLSKPLAR